MNSLEAGFREVDLVNRAFVPDGVKMARFIFAERDDPLRHGADLAGRFQNTVFQRQPDEAPGREIRADMYSVKG